MTVLLVLFTIMLFLAIDQGIQYFRRRKAAEALKQFSIPAGVDLATNHLWVKKASGAAVIGMDEFLATMLGSPNAVAIPAAGTRVVPPSASLTIRVGDRDLALALPVQGKVVAVNTDAIANPSLLASDPYGRGWLVKMEPFHRPGPSVKLVRKEELGTWLRNQFDQAKEFLAARSAQPAMMQDGGAPVAGVLRQYDADVWKEFQSTFVSPEISN